MLSSADRSLEDDDMTELNYAKHRQNISCKQLTVY